MPRLRLVAFVALTTAALCVGGCPPPPVDDGGGPGEEGESEGEGEGEGEGEDLPTATVALRPQFALPADGVSAFSVSIQLAGPHAGGRAVTVRTVPAGPDDVGGTSGADGALVVNLVSTIAGTFAIEVDVDGFVVDVGDATVEFSVCRSLEDTFLVDAWPVALSRCVGCHNEFGFSPSLGARFVLPFPGDDGFASRGVAAVRDMLAFTAADGLDVDTATLTPEQRATLLLEDDEATLPLMLANPILGDITGHTGGVVISAAEAVEIRRFRSFIARVEAGADTCGAGSVNGISDEDLVPELTLLSPRETLKRAALTLNARNPSAAELLAVTDEATLANALDSVIDDVRTEVRLLEVWNDWLLTDAALGQNPSYVGQSFPLRTFFEKLQSEGARGNNSCNDSVATDCCRVAEDPLNLDADPDNNVAPRPENVLCEQKRLEVRTALAREPLEILRRIWRDDRPASQMITGEFTIVNPALARIYGLLQGDGRTFRDGTTTAFNATPADDATETRLVRVINTAANRITTRNASLDAWPHQGILSTPSWLRRYATTTSNRERTRARFIYEGLLGVPVMQLAAFATPEIPAGKSLENLTWDTQPCIVCHTLLDPVAGTFNHFAGSGGALIARRPCRADGMRAPGFGFVALPGSGDADEGLPRPALDLDDCVAAGDGTGAGANDTQAPVRLDWLTDQVSAHPRFAYAVVLPLFEGLTGAPILNAPDSVVDPDFTAKARAFASQQKEIARAVAAFRAGNGRFRPVVKAILMGASFRAAATAGDQDADTDRALELLRVGDGALLTTPEVLDRKITALVGVPWAHLRNPAAPNALADDAFYSIFAGGIDSATVTVRSRDPVAVRAAVARRLGNEVSCIAVPQDFSIVDPAQRRLFGDVEMSDVPIDADGNVVGAADARVRTQIRTLHQTLWNEDVIDEAEVDASHALFIAALQAYRSPATGTTPVNIGATCQAVSAFVRGTRTPYPANGTVVIDGIERRRVNADPDFVVRAWSAVLSSILADSRFLFE